MGVLSLVVEVPSVVCAITTILAILAIIFSSPRARHLLAGLIFLIEMALVQ